MTTNDGNEHAIGKELTLYRAPGLDPLDNLSFPPYLANIVLSGFSSMLGNAMGSATYWGLVGGALTFGGLGSVAVIGEAARLLLGDNGASYGSIILVDDNAASNGSLVLELSAAAAVIAAKMGWAYGGVKGLVNAEYHEYFDTRAWDEAVCVGVSHPPENDY